MMLKALAAVALSLITLPAVAAPVPLSALSNYLNSLAQVSASFQQGNSDGSDSSGQLIIHRPGRMRLEYDPPEKSLVIVAGGTVVVFDPKSNEPPTQYPLARTPLNLILAPQIDLTTAKMVVGTAEVGGLTHVVAQDPKHPEYGNIELIFTASPVSLTGWIVTDDSGNQTSVKLGPFKTEQDIPAMTFSVDHELLMRNR